MNKYTQIMMSNMRLLPFINDIYKTTELISQYGNVRLLSSLELGRAGDVVRPPLNRTVNVEGVILKKLVKKTTITSSLNRPLIYSYIDTPESANIKYKQTFYTASYDKLGETIVEIANSGGGKLVWGIRKDLFIVGVENDNSLWDNHCVRLIETLKRSDASNIPGIKFTEQRLSGKRNIYHVTIAPSCELLSYNGIEITRIEFNLLKQQLESVREEINTLTTKKIQY
jgi:hypothetical protein